MLYKDAGVNVGEADKFVKMIGSDNSYAATVPLPCSQALEEI